MICRHTCLNVANIPTFVRVAGHREPDLPKREWEKGVVSVAVHKQEAGVG